MDFWFLSGERLTEINDEKRVVVKKSVFEGSSLRGFPRLVLDVQIEKAL